VNKFVQLAMICLAALGSAAISAYAIAHLLLDLGVARAALRNQALVCAALVTGLVTIELLASREG
jgi:hypothetical protein